MFVKIRHLVIDIINIIFLFVILIAACESSNGYGGWYNGSTSGFVLKIKVRLLSRRHSILF